MTPFQQLLQKYRETSQNKREKGDYFEKLVLHFLKNDKRYSNQFIDVEYYSDWSKKRGDSGIDHGIDLIATNMDETFTAIQCKFFDKSLIAKNDIDSFFAASDRLYFTRRILVDTSEHGLNDVVNKQVHDSSSSKDFNRITLDKFEDSNIDWEVYLDQNQLVKSKPRNNPRAHQLEAIEKTLSGFKTSDRGKLIMACGTGKTLTALKIAENIAGQNKRVLFLMPSLALISQALNEWAQQSSIDIYPLAVCSDSEIGKKRADEDDIGDVDATTLAYPANTDPKKLADNSKKLPISKMLVVYSTYQSLDVVYKAQNEYGMDAFDLIVCDEAHRTTGSSINNREGSNFTKIHEKNYIQGYKRLYMTATPRIYSDEVKKEADKLDATIYSMNNIDDFGETFYSIKFGEAVEKGLLSDYKVIILAVARSSYDSTLEESISTANLKINQSNDNSKLLELDDALKMIGIYKGLIKDINNKNIDMSPMKRVVAFTNTIASSKLFTSQFANVINNVNKRYNYSDIEVDVDHIDGKMGANDKTKKIMWLKDYVADNKCKILSNARCLSEGIDVPSLDGVIFIHGKKSMVDIVQAVGRVMRKSESKKLGYVILPVIIPENIDENESLKANSNYQIIWDVLNSLRSHDERLDSRINKMSFHDSLNNKIEDMKEFIEVVVTSNKLVKPKIQEEEKTNIGGDVSDAEKHGDEDKPNIHTPVIKQDLLTGTWDDQRVLKDIYTKIAKKCGNRYYWEDWATDVADIAQKHILRLQNIISNSSSNAHHMFNKFAEELRKTINESIQNDEIIEMLAQHIITKPIFDTLFKDYKFAEHNPISLSMQGVLNELDKHVLNSESQKLENFYASVKRRIDGISDAEGRQKILVELYDKFFRNAFPKVSQKLGIVYTPIEVVDFIIHSVNDILKQEFNKELGDKDVHIIDPFTGTGTFITRLIQSNLLTKEQLKYKYNTSEKIVNNQKIKTTELHANEIVLLAYYIATINIESVYHDIVGEGYKSFEGICLTDTFQEPITKEVEVEEEFTTSDLKPLLQENSQRRKVQRSLPIRVFIGNPPYSAGQNSGNDNNQNVKYPQLDQSIKDTYDKQGTATLKNSLYDSYIRAIRWASDKIDQYGVIGFITNAGWIDSNSADGLRKCMKDEFSNIYILNLRGAIRGKSGDAAKREGKNVFDIMTGVAITIWVKNPRAKEQGKIYYYDIGDYLDRDEKLNSLTKFKSINSLIKNSEFKTIIPDKYNDWLGQRNDEFYKHISLGDKKNKNDICIFENYSNGLATNRDAWIYNFSRSKLEKNVSSMIDFYNSEVERYVNSEEIKNQPDKLDQAEKYVANFVNNDSTKIAWSRDLREDMAKQQSKKITDLDEILTSIYRPFIKSWCFYKKDIINTTYQIPKIFPEDGLENLVIGVTRLGAKKGFSVLISNIITDLNTLEAGCQCFPMYLYEKISHNYEEESTNDKDQFNEEINKLDSENITIVKSKSGKFYKKKYAITDYGLKHFTDFYNDKLITKEDLFYYIYGILHSEKYKLKYADNLTKALPRIPRIDKLENFKKFEEAGRKLAKLHIDYENVAMYPVSYVKDIAGLKDKDFYVTKMKFLNKGDKSKIVYNSNITIENIPLEAYEYVVNGKAAIEWVMDRQDVSVHKDSNIENNANDWAIETMDNPRYPLELLLRIITVSIETVKIIKTLSETDL